MRHCLENTCTPERTRTPTSGIHGDETEMHQNRNVGTKNRRIIRSKEKLTPNPHDIWENRKATILGLQRSQFSFLLIVFARFPSSDQNIFFFLQKEKVRRIALCVPRLSCASNMIWFQSFQGKLIYQRKCNNLKGIFWLSCEESIAIFSG